MRELLIKQEEGYNFMEDRVHYRVGRPKGKIYPLRHDFRLDEGLDEWLRDQCRDREKVGTCIRRLLEQMQGEDIRKHLNVKTISSYELGQLRMKGEL